MVWCHFAHVAVVHEGEVQMAMFHLSDGSIHELHVILVQTLASYEGEQGYGERHGDEMASVVLCIEREIPVLRL